VRRRTADQDVKPAERVLGLGCSVKGFAFDGDVAMEGGAPPPASSINRAVCVALAMSMSQQATAAPASAKAIEIDRPMPPAAPLIRAAFPVSTVPGPSPGTAGS